MKFSKIISSFFAAAFVSNPALANWSNFTYVNEWNESTGRIGARSALTSPIDTPDWPYHDMKAQLYVDGCDLAWIRFNKAPNLVGGDIESGYTLYSVQARADGKDVWEPMFQEWNSKDLSWNRGDSVVIAGWAKEESYAIRLPHYGGAIIYSFDMDGARETIGRSCVR